MSEEITKCIYCTQLATRDKLMMKLHEFPNSTLYLWNSDSNYKGRCVLVAKQHEREIFELPESIRLGFAQEMMSAAAAIKKATKAEKINYGAFGDTMPHVHFHLVPKKSDGGEWGSPFIMNRGEKAVPLTSEEISALSQGILGYLKAS